MSDATPPRLAEKLLALAVPNPDWQDTIVGDLREEFATETDRRGFTAHERGTGASLCQLPRA